MRGHGTAQVQSESTNSESLAPVKRGRGTRIFQVSYDLFYLSPAHLQVAMRGDVMEAVKLGKVVAVGLMLRKASRASSKVSLRIKIKSNSTPRALRTGVQKNLPLIPGENMVAD